MTATDEDERKAETFTDKDGKTILTRELLGAEWLETWFAYDEKGQLRYVFPPELTKDSNFWTDKEKLELYAWSFAYDKEGRIVEQKAPGCEPVTYKYEPFYDRLLEMQDGALREKGESIMFTYDKQGRLQHTVLNSKNSMLYLEDLLYDSPGRNFVPTPGYSQDYSGNTAGYLTARNAYLVYAGNNTFVQTNYYYDSEGRIIQQVEKTLSRTTLRTDYKYDFPGNLVAVREAHTYEGKTDVVEQLMRYDDRGRIKETSLSLNGTPCAKVYYTYDHAGRLAGKIAGKASQVFRYNAQGWLTEMEGSAFSYKLRYENPEGDTPARWNGNISEWEWKQGTESPLMYAFQYDGLERLEGATQFKETESGWQAMENSFTEKGISYDRNGNILTLQRTANGNTVDDLAYSYNGNILTGVAENIRSVAEGDVYAPGSSVSATFEYDENGNLVKNGHLGLVFQYNCLNLPWYVKRDGKTLATFYYLGDGTKVQTVDSAGVARHYIGSLTYRQEGNGNLVLEEIAFDGGIVKVSEDGTPETFYCITDHLGSVRAMVDAEGNAVERNDYYPFGAQHARTDYPQIANRYKFNGKEREKAGGADWLDYGARRYDPALARWTTPDPLGDSYLPYSPYAYCLNNPVKLVDPDGTYMDWFMNEVSGDVYYNSSYGEDDAGKINGEGWTWLGGNGMFSAGTVGDLLSDWDAILHGSDNFRLRVENVGTEDNPEFNIEAQIQGESAKSFMKGKGYDFKPKEYIYQKDVIRDLHPEATGKPMEITIDNSHILEVLSYQYVPETTNLKESKVLESKNFKRNTNLIGFSPVNRIHEEAQLRQIDIYDEKFHVNNKLVESILKVIPLQDFMEQITKKIMK